MVLKKKKVKRSQSVARRSFAKKNPTNLGSHLGMIERLVRPKEKEVRVKTFIVERPVYIQSDKKFPARGYDSVYDANESKYNRLKKKNDEEDYVEEYEARQGGRNKSLKNKEFVEDDSLEEVNEDYSDGEIPDDEFSEDQEPIDELPEEDIGKEPTGHFRSRGLFMNVWWKKALLLGAVWWIGIFVFTFLLQVLGLIIIDLSRDWLFLLIVIEVFSLVYQKYFSGKLKI